MNLRNPFLIKEREHDILYLLFSGRQKRRQDSFRMTNAQSFINGLLCITVQFPLLILNFAKPDILIHNISKMLCPLLMIDGFKLQLPESA